MSSVLLRSSSLKERDRYISLFHVCVDFYKCHRDYISLCSSDTVNKLVHELTELFASAVLADTADLI